MEKTSKQKVSGVFDGKKYINNTFFDIDLIKEEIEKSKTERMEELHLQGYDVSPTVRGKLLLMDDSCKMYLVINNKKDVNKMKSEYEKKIQALQDRINELEHP
jgi:hypothetical protein